LDYVARDEVSFIYGGRSIRRAVDDNEDIKLEASMFDGYVTVPKLGDVASDEDLRLHISVIVDISRGDGGEKLEFLCSAWPDHLEIQKVYLLGHRRCWVGLLRDLISGMIFFFLMIVVLVFVLQSGFG
jgi:complement component 1 Q subcomponent-binding protein